jgi:molybdate transport system permease protein
MSLESPTLHAFLVQPGSYASLAPLFLSVEVAVLATLIAGVLGVAAASLLANVKFFGRDALDAILCGPLVLPPTVLGYYLLVLFGRRSFLGGVYEHLTGSSIVFTRTGAVLAAAVGALPLIVKFSRAALEGVDPLLVPAARTLGASPLRALVTIQIPVAARGIVAAVMLGFARSLGDFGATLMVAGDIPGETQTASLSIFDSIQAQEQGEAVVMIVLLSAVAFWSLYLANKLIARGHEH